MMIRTYPRGCWISVFTLSILLSGCGTNAYFHSQYHTNNDFNPQKHCFTQLNTLKEHSIHFHDDEHGHNISASSVDLNNFHQEAHCAMMPTARETSIEYHVVTQRN